MRTLPSTIGLASLIACLLFATATGTASAQSTVTVTTTADSGTGSLRDAILTSSAGDTIDFDAALFTSTSTVTIPLTATLSISKTLTIEGPALASGNRVQIDGQSSVRIFNLSGTADITFRRLELMNGSASPYGGAIQWNTNSSSSRLMCEDVIFRDNTSTYGGAVFVADLAGFDCNRCLFDGSTASVNHGGACAITRTPASFTNTTFHNNEAGNLGGALFVQATLTNEGATKLDFCTFLGNHSRQNGAAVNPADWNTLAPNFYSLTYGSTTSTSLIVSNTVFFDNTNASAGNNNANIGGSWTTLGYNFLDDAFHSPSSTVSGLYIRPGQVDTDRPTSNTGDQLGDRNASNILDPMEDPAGLADNGGYSETVNLTAMSPLVDAANPASTVTEDQRSEPRPVGTASDIGAHEWVSPNQPPSVTGTNGVAGTGPYTLSGRQGDTIAGDVTVTDPDGDAITIASVQLPMPAIMGLSVPAPGTNGTDTNTLDFSGTIDPATPAGTYDYVVTYEDGVTMAQTFTVQITVIENNLPTIEAIEGFTGTGPFEIEVTKGEEFTAELQLTDADGDTISLAAIIEPGQPVTGITLPTTPQSTTGPISLVFTGTPDFSVPSETYDYTLTWDDGTVTTNTATVRFVVISPPVVSNGNNCQYDPTGSTSLGLAGILLTMMTMLFVVRRRSA